MTDESRVAPKSYLAMIDSLYPPEMRAAMSVDAAGWDVLQDFPELAAVTVEDVTIQGVHGGVSARRYRRGAEAADAGLVWVHGGGFIGGDLDMPEAHWVALALADRGIPVLSLDYRKCLHGVHFPLPSDDVLVGWRWARRHADLLGTTAERLHLGGSSAGGNLVAGVTKRLRDEDPAAMPATLVLAYSVVHATLPPLAAELEQRLATTDQRIDPHELMAAMALHFAGSEEMLDDPYAFAGNGDVGGQPPVYILNSDADAIRASGERYADQLRAAGVPVGVELEPGTAHGHLNSPHSDSAQHSIARIARWLLGDHQQATSIHG